MENIYQEAINKWGAEPQILMAIEEMAELTDALCKAIRGRETNVEEEIADVKIVLKQLEIMFDKKEVDEWEKKKLKRLERRIEWKI